MTGLLFVLLTLRELRSQFARKRTDCLFYLSTSAYKTDNSHIGISGAALTSRSIGRRLSADDGNSVLRARLTRQAGTMEEYHVCLFGTGPNNPARRIAQCTDDLAAIAWATGRRETLDIEIWHSARLVTRRNAKARARPAGMVLQDDTGAPAAPQGRGTDA
jgi:hypothetical protein